MSVYSISHVLLFLLQELFHCHDVIKKRQYDKPAPQLESTPFIHINRDSYKTVGLHKSADEPLVCVYECVHVCECVCV